MSQTQAQAANLADKAVVLNLELGRVSNACKLPSNTTAVKTTIDRDMLHISVDLFDAQELKDCWNFLYALKASIRGMTVPSFLRGGMYMVKVEGVETVDTLLTQAVVNFKPIVQAFADVVDERREQSKERLGPAYDAGKYPTREQVLTAFKIEWRWLTLDTPSSLKNISKAFFEREAQKAEESLKSAVEDIVVLLTLEAKKLADHMIERLTPGEDGKPKIFKASAVDNITNFLATFNLRNLGTSDELNGQVERMRKLIEGVDPKDLRKSDRLREDMAAGFEKVSLALDKLVITKPHRFIEIAK